MPVMEIVLVNTICVPVLALPLFTTSYIHSHCLEEVNWDFPSTGRGAHHLKQHLLTSGQPARREVTIYSNLFIIAYL